ncbi:DUF3696 domain-containing protein [Paenibacillus hemerocallicola]|uniref:DUF3696 domain-containing protein n=1 Tax=Paenibacillus hemerocallicola TaxID=1172614 RepID=A0A5C4T6R1_9BACL|nr:DUF3696 domain-containing protein [Paenibacillus hemerocallicola]TNJ64017.1 DUF3696 domain-containing protein [Paenibacillus hemerocallicola]
MLHLFDVKDFKGHAGNNRFELPGLTIVSGTNNSGKSSLLQGTYLLTQNKTNGKFTTLELNERLRLGSFSDVLNKETDRTDTIEFVAFFDRDFLMKDSFETLRVQLVYQSQSLFAPSGFMEEDEALLTGMTLYYRKENEEPRNVEFQLLENENNNALFKITGDTEEGYSKITGIVPEPIFYKDTDMTERFICSKELEIVRNYLARLNTDNIRYLSTHRSPDAQKPSGEGRRHGVGVSGEYTAEMIKNRLHDLIDFKDPDHKPYAFSKLFDMWVSELLGPEYRIRSEVQDGASKIYVHEPHRNMKFSLQQVGSGISQLLPMLVMILTSKHGDILLIENPELDLHPKLQAQFVDLCIFALEHGRKFILETHSEHIVNRARLRIKNRNELLEKIRIYFFRKIDGDIRCTPIAVTAEGKIEEWPEHFFDQTYQDLMGLIE